HRRQLTTTLEKGPVMAALPNTYAYGNVALHVAHVVADTTGDPDDNPDAQPATGKITFTPDETVRVIDPVGVSLHAPVVAELYHAADLSDAEGNKWSRLVTGTYQVSFAVTGAGKRLPSITVTVTADHTEESPLDLADYFAAVPPEIISVCVLTQDEYDAISDPDSRTAYIIRG